MRGSEKRSKKRKKRPQVTRKSEENVLNLAPSENRVIPGRVNQLWRWDTLEDVAFK